MVDHDAADTATAADAIASPVEFIDAWLRENAPWIDTRVTDFALDLRTMLSADDPEDAFEREPVGADA